MRHLLICSFLLAAFFASAQTPEKRCQYRPSKEFILSKGNEDCFDITRREADRAFAARCWDEAMSLYGAAKSCADVEQKSSLSEMENRIKVCRDSAAQELGNKLLPGFKIQTDTQMLEKRCKYRPSREFLLSKSDSCFDITRREADRAFAARCWDEATLLYRAAKSCADANQKSRSDMNKRIEACRESAEQELRASEQAARRSELIARLGEQAVRRQFLQVTANNIANDAQDLLKNYDRSAAYRLADFAEQYIAPSPNPKCLQALLDAWYYVPPEQSGQSEPSGLRVPFCYQLDYDMGGYVQARFDTKNRLYAFAPSSGTLRSWVAESLRPLPPVQIEKGLPNFDISPDDQTLLFFSKNTLLFWRSPKDTFRVKVPNISRYCFTPSGSEFLFFDAQQAKVYSFDFRGSDTQRNANVQRKGERRPELRPLFSVNFEVFGMTFSDGRLWLGGRDSLAIFEQGGGKERLWRQVATIAWDKQLPGELVGLHISPARRAAFVVSNDSLHYYRLPGDGDSLVVATKWAGVQGAPLAIKPDASWFAYSHYGTLLRISSDTGPVHYASYLQPDETFWPLHGAISPDNRWLVAATDTGALKIWDLRDWQSNVDASLDSVNRVAFSQTGNYFAYYGDGSLRMYATGQPERPLFAERGFPENTIVDAAGENWIAWRADTAILHTINGVTGKKWGFPVQSSLDSYLPVAFDENGQFVAYPVAPDTVVVCSLTSGAVLARQTFNGEVLQLRFVPQRGELVVVQSGVSGYDGEQHTIAKLWNPATAGSKPRPIRLHEYKIGWSAIAPKGDKAAFSSGKDIRVFGLDNLLDESARIRPNGEHFVSALAFHPDGSALAVGYDNGTVIVWDLTSGEERFHLKVADDWVEELSFSADGNRLRLKTLGGPLLSRDISPNLIRAAAQNENRRLAAFTPEQIRTYDLERALDYSGNFQQLAESDDLPLIRSFFEYYRQQALSSNNIDKVKAYFESASNLFSKLDNPATQRALRPVMFGIYEDYNWKLLLREKNAEAQRVLNEFNRLFGQPLAAVKISAHTALLRNDLPAAARQYADWTMRVFENSPFEPYMALDSLEQQFRQLAVYDLLDEEQLNCICGLYANVLEINNICPQGGNASTVPLDAETHLRWSIFQKLHTASSLISYSQKARLLESAFADAQMLNQQNPTRWRGQLEKTTLALAGAYTGLGDFERDNENTKALYQQALQLLDTFGIFKENEPERLKQLAANRQRLGNYLLFTDRIAEAARQYELGLQTLEQLFRITPADSVPIFRNDRQAPLLTQLGMARLLEGNTAAAKTAYQHADEAMTYGVNSLYFGHIALFENNENEALNRYKNESTGIYNESQLGQVLFEINRMAARFPDRRARLEAFTPRLRGAILAERPKMSPEAVDYYLAEQQKDYAFANGRWEDAVAWNAKSLAVLEKQAGQQDISNDWKKSKLDALLSRSYYLLYVGKNNPEAFAQSIACTEQAEAYAEKEYPTYIYRDWLKTNLAHAFLLRNRPNERDKAISIYRAFLQTPSYSSDHWELLQKDFRDLHRAGLRWPDLKGIIEAIKPPDVEISAKEWQEMGAVN